MFFIFIFYFFSLTLQVIYFIITKYWNGVRSSSFSSRWYPIYVLGKGYNFMYFSPSQNFPWYCLWNPFGRSHYQLFFSLTCFMSNILWWQSKRIYCDLPKSAMCLPAVLFASNTTPGCFLQTVCLCLEWASGIYFEKWSPVSNREMNR